MSNLRAWITPNSALPLGFALRSPLFINFHSGLERRNALPTKPVECRCNTSHRAFGWPALRGSYNNKFVHRSGEGDIDSIRPCHKSLGDSSLSHLHSPVCVVAH